MSIHKSLKPKGRLKRVRNVLSRRERVELLMERDEWEEGESVFGLPKVKRATATMVSAGELSEETEDDEETGEEGAAEAGAEETLTEEG